MKAVRSRILLLLLMLAFVNLNAQSSLKFSEAILGNWEGSGTLFGLSAKFQMAWKQEVHKNFITLTFENRFKDNSGTERVMHAKAFYHLEENGGQWFDSRGMLLPLQLEINENSMTVLWGDETTERGKTIYSVMGDKVDVQDFVLRNDTYQPFGEASYSRKKE